MAAPSPQQQYNLVLEEVLLRLPPDDPASLVNAALVCKRWARVVTGPAFRARLGAAPMLGFLCDLRGGNDSAISRFVLASTSTFRARPAELRGWRAADARHGRVLLYPLRKRFARPRSALAGLAVCVPATREFRRLPAPPPPIPRCWSWSASLLCGCDVHRPGCHGGPFRVVLVATNEGDEGRIFSCVYSSEDAAWGEVASSAHPESSPVCLESVPGVLVGNALHFLFQWSASILRYDLGSRQVSVIQKPPTCAYYQGRPLLMIMEDGRLGFASVKNSVLSIWPREVGADGEARWGQSRVIRIPTHERWTYLLGFADEFGVLFLWTAFGGLSLFNLKSDQVEEFETEGDIYGVVPFVSYCIPALGTVTTDEEA